MIVFRQDQTRSDLTGETVPCDIPCDHLSLPDGKPITAERESAFFGPSRHERLGALQLLSNRLRS